MKRLLIITASLFYHCNMALLAYLTTQGRPLFPCWFIVP